MKGTLRTLLASRRAPWVAALLALALLSPALGAGYLLDDYPFQISILESSRAAGIGRADWDLFNFEDGDPGHFARGRAWGIWPWWVADDFRLAFLRPLSSLMLAAEFRHLARWPALLHAHSLLWYAALVLVVGALHRRILGAGLAAGLATLLYAIDDAHAFPALWISHRNALIALTFGFAAVLAHDRATRPAPDAAPGPAWPAPLLLALGLAAGEAAFGALAWIVAHALLLDARPRAARARSLAPFALVALAWIVVNRALGYGAAGGGFYIDPARQPFAFTAAMLTRLPLLLLSQLALPPADLWMQQPASVQIAAGAAAWVILALGALWLRRALRDDPLAPFLLGGTVLSLVPACATWPGDRLLLASGLGGFAFVARLMTNQRAPRGFVTAAVIAHAVIAPALLPLKVVAIHRIFGGAVDRAAASLPWSDDPSRHAYLVLTTPDWVLPMWAGQKLMLERGAPMPGSMHTLTAHITGTLTLRRVDARTLDLELSAGFLHDPMSQLAHGRPFRFARDLPRDAGVFVATPRALTDDGRPRAVRFVFRRDLDDPAHVWIRWEGDRYVRWSPPPVGASITLPPIDMARAMHP